MDIEQMIKKWDEQIALHRRVCDDPLMYTKEERLKNSHYAQAICAVLADLKQVKNISSNTVLADSLPNCCEECSKELESGTVFCSADCRRHYYS